MCIRDRNVAYVEPSRRPTDGRYGENPNRLQHYFQFQVILKPSPDDVQDLYLGSLRALGIQDVYKRQVCALPKAETSIPSVLANP